MSNFACLVRRLRMQELLTPNMRIQLSLALVVLAACGSKSPPAAHPPAKPLTWKDMDATQREQFMKDVVMPKSKALFVEFDAKKYADMDCGTCHGDGATAGWYWMPNPKIKPLPNTPEASMARVSKDAEAARYADFMAAKLEPAVAEMLQLTPFDPKTNSGEFSCSNCHQLVDASGKVAPDSMAKPRDEHDHHHGEGHEHH